MTGQHTASSRRFRDLLTWVRGSPATVGVLAFLCGWFILSQAVAASLGAEAYVSLVVATATPSPGWLFAAATHASVGHLVSNALPLAVWGSVTERFVGRRRYLALVAVAGVGGIFVQVVVYLLRGVDGGVVGASAAVQAVVAFAVVAPILTDRRVVDTPGLGVGLALGGAVMLGGQALNDFTGFVSFVPEASGVSHVVGGMVGVSYAVLWGLAPGSTRSPEATSTSDR